MSRVLIFCIERQEAFCRNSTSGLSESYTFNAKMKFKSMKRKIEQLTAWFKCGIRLRSLIYVINVANSSGLGTGCVAPYR